MKMNRDTKSYMALGKAKGAVKMATHLIDAVDDKECLRTTHQMYQQQDQEFEMLWNLGHDLVNMLEPHRRPE